MARQPKETTMRRLLATVCAAALVLAACGDSDGGEAPPATDPATTTTTTVAVPPPTVATLPPPTTTIPADLPTTTSAPAAAGGQCVNPDGFAVQYPAGWHTNSGDVVAECSMFHPQPFEVPDSTDVRVAAISAFVEDVDYHDVIADLADPALTTIDGHQAVRVEEVTGDDGIYPEGTAYTRYFVDLDRGADAGPGTLVMDTVDLDGFDYAEARDVLDDLAAGLQLDQPGTAEIVARYEGGGTSIVVTAFPQDDALCLMVQPEGTPACGPRPAATGVVTVPLGDAGIDVLAGFAGTDVFAVSADFGGNEITYLPVATSMGAGGFVLTVAEPAVARLVWTDRDGSELGSARIDESVEAVGPFASYPVRSEGFPGGGEPVFLTDVRVADHGGFERLVLEFEGAPAVPFEVAYVPAAVDVRGNEVPLSGHAVLQVTAAAATSVDRSGEEPVVTYDDTQRFQPAGTEAILDVFRAQDFENHLVMAIGIAEERPFAVVQLQNPLRLVVDVATR